MKIDIFNHIVTPRYRDARLKVAPPQLRLQDQERTIPALFDLDARFRAMDIAGDGYVQIKIITHHLGGFAPYASERIREGYDKFLRAARARNEPIVLAKHPQAYFHDFYADTITIGSVPALRCGIDFFGTGRVMFATDMPFDTQGGVKYVEVALRAMEEIDLSSDDKVRIYEHNARRLFGLGGA